MEIQTFDNVWDALTDTPEEAANMILRSQLMNKIQSSVEDWNTTQKEAAERLGLTQPRLNDLLRGRISKFSLDILVNIATKANLNVRIEIKEAA